MSKHNIRQVEWRFGICCPTCSSSPAGMSSEQYRTDDVFLYVCSFYIIAFPLLMYITLRPAATQNQVRWLFTNSRPLQGIGKRLDAWKCSIYPQNGSEPAHVKGTGNTMAIFSSCFGLRIEVCWKLIRTRTSSMYLGMRREVDKSFVFQVAFTRYLD